MYSKFTSKNIKEYNKIICVIDSIDLEQTNPDQLTFYHSTICNLIELFANNLDKRSTVLKRNLNLLHIRTQLKQLKRFNSFSEFLLNDLVEQTKQWVELAKGYYNSQEAEEPRIEIKGIM